MRTAWNVLSAGLFVIGVLCLVITFYLWFGDWPSEQKQLVDHLRSVARNVARPPEPLLQNTGGRETVSLNGAWQAVIDPYNRGELGGLAARAVEPGTPSDLAEFSYRNGLTLDVPGDWNTQDPRLVFYQGAVWYKRTFDWAKAEGERVFLHFGAANYRASIYVNGLLRGEHEGGFTPFNFDVTDDLRSGENLLVVKVDNRRADDDVPTPITDWHNYGGLTRDVSLLRVPQVHVRSWQLGLGDDGARIEGWIEAVGLAKGKPVVLRIDELGIEHAFEVDEAGRASVAIEANPERWSPENPRLYDVELRAGEDRVRDRIGFRTVAVRDGEILLNGEPVFLRGIAIHEERPVGGGRIHSEGQSEIILGWAKELGANFVLLAHYPHDESMSKVADRMGLLVWEEIPVYWAVDFGNEKTLTRARRQLSELIERDRNRASVILWSIGNETPEGEARNAFLQNLADHVRTEDSTRLVTAAMLTGADALTGFLLWGYLPAVAGLPVSNWVFDVQDPLADMVDVPALNEYFGWYYSGALAMLLPWSSHHMRRVMLDGMEEIEIRTPAGKPLIVSELGAGAKFGMHSPDEDLAVYSEEYQALVYEKQLAMLGKQPQLRGISPWILKDFRAPLRMYQGVQDYWNRKGLVSDEGEKKQAFFVLRDHYAAGWPESTLPCRHPRRLGMRLAKSSATPR